MQDLDLETSSEGNRSFKLSLTKRLLLLSFLETIFYYYFLSSISTIIGFLLKSSNIIENLELGLDRCR